MKAIESQGSRSRWGLGTAGVLWVCGAVACGPMQPEPLETSGGPAPVTSVGQTLPSDNGESLNGLAFNGLAFNGLAFNGLAFNGLNSEAFSSWYDQDPALADNVMKYVTACAVPAGQTRTYTDSQGQVRVWSGSLGLAPDWVSGRPATVTEQQLVSACLAAHVNKFGRTVPISVLGRTAHEEPIATTPEELQTFSQREGCFFGNLFTEEGVFVGHDDLLLSPQQSSVRACALEPGQEGCAPISQVGPCASRCTPDPTNTSYTHCTLDGTTYAAITTRIRPQEIYTCGDGVCQFTESCGLGTDSAHCTADCGPCAP
ncbi:hypothetical protein [Cystobacter fuscus]|uniref:hypothetical protein n=1 Tax=Cystobacter fuscus TaxID=43 RepID=UPI002B2DD6C5|nr:hypothetical protein F0U63_10665 [Cystobacter fuscus]